MKWSIIIFSILVMFCCKFAAADDSIPSKQLKEVIVLGDNQWIEKGVMNFIPSKNAKKLSNSPASLIKSMHLPFIKRKTGLLLVYLEKLFLFL